MTADHSKKTVYRSPSFQVTSSELDNATVRCSGGGIGVTCIGSAFGISCEGADIGVLCKGASTVGIACTLSDNGVACQEGRASVSCLHGSAALRTPSSEQNLSDAVSEKGDPHEVPNL